MTTLFFTVEYLLAPDRKKVLSKLDIICYNDSGRPVVRMFDRRPKYKYSSKLAFIKIKEEDKLPDFVNDEFKNVDTIVYYNESSLSDLLDDLNDPELVALIKSKVLLNISAAYSTTFSLPQFTKIMGCKVHKNNAKNLVECYKLL